MRHNIIPVLFILLSLLTSCGSDVSTEKTVRTLDDLNGLPVGVLTGSVQEMVAHRVVPQATFVQFKSEADMTFSLNQGKVAAGFISALTLNMIKVDFPELFCLTDTLGMIPCASIFQKGNSRLVEAYNDFLEGYLQSEEYQESCREWADRNTTRRMPKADSLSLSNGILKVGTPADSPPHTMMMNNEVSGIEAEIVARFAYSIGMKPEFMIVDFPSLLASVSTGKCDVGFYSICITEERARKVDFGIPDVYESTACLVNRNYVAADVLEAAGVSSDSGSVEKSLWSEVKASFVRNIIQENRYELLLEGLWNTIIIVIFSAIFGTLLGIFLCFMNMNKRKWVRSISTIYIEFMRCMPQMVFLMIMFYIVFGNSSADGIVISIISFALCFGAYTSVIFQSAVECIDHGQTEAALSLGFTRMKNFFFIILPQAVQNAMPVYRGEFIGLVKATSIVGYIAVFDLTKASDVIRSRTFEAFFPLIIITVLYFLIIWVLSIALKYAEIKTKPKRRKY